MDKRKHSIIKTSLGRLCLALGLILCLSCWGTNEGWAAGRNKKKRTTESIIPMDTLQQTRANHIYLEALKQRIAGHDDHAAELLYRTVEIDTTQAPAYHLLARLHAEHDDFATAEEMIKHAIRIDSTAALYNETAAEIYISMQQYDQAAHYYEQAARYNPAFASDYYRDLAQIYLEAGDINKGISSIMKIEEIEGISPQTSYQLFYLLKLKYRNADAFEQLKKLTQKFPYEPKHKITYGKELMNIGHYNEAGKQFNEALKLDPNNDELWLAITDLIILSDSSSTISPLVKHALLNTQIETETKCKILEEILEKDFNKKLEKIKASETPQDTVLLYSEAEALLQASIEKHPEEDGFPFIYSLFLMKNNKDLALQQVRKAVDLAPEKKKNWEAYLSLLVLLKEDKGLIYEGAKEAVRRLPQIFFGHYLVALYHIEEGKLSKALSVYYDAIPYFTNDIYTTSTIYQYIGDLLHEMGETDKCYNAYEEALRYNPDNFSVLNNYSYFLALEKRDLLKAEQMCSKVIQKYPDEPTYLDTYAWIFFQQGNYILAKFYQESALNKAGEKVSSELLHHYGDILFMSGNEAEAVTYWEKALKLAEEPSPILEKKIQEKKYIENNVSAQPSNEKQK